MIGVADARWTRIAGAVDMAIPVEDVDLLGGDAPDSLDDALLASVGPGCRVFDLGASVGWFSLLAARRGARVVAVDASPRRVDHLRLSASENGLTSVEVVHAAVTGRVGTARYLSRRTDRRVVEGSSSKDLVSVPATSAAALAAAYGPPDLVRVNLPGWECEATAIAAGTIGVRADLVAMAARRVRLAEVVASLRRNAAEPVWLDGRTARPPDLTRPHPDARVPLLAGGPDRPLESLTDDERIRRYEAEARQNPAARRARLAVDLAGGGDLLRDARVQALLERLVLDPAERVVRAVRWWRSHPARAATLVDRAHALQGVLATRLSLD